MKKPLKMSQLNPNERKAYEEIKHQWLTYQAANPPTITQRGLGTAEQGRAAAKAMATMAANVRLSHNVAMIKGRHISETVSYEFEMLVSQLAGEWVRSDKQQTWPQFLAARLKPSPAPRSTTPDPRP